MCESCIDVAQLNPFSHAMPLLSAMQAMDE